MLIITLLFAIAGTTPEQVFNSIVRDPTAWCALSPSGNSETCCAGGMCCTNHHLDNVYSCHPDRRRIPVPKLP